jgi:hypothetical protein
MTAVYAGMLETMWVTWARHPEATQNALYEAAAALMTRKIGHREEATYTRVLKQKWPSFRDRRRAERSAALSAALLAWTPPRE